MLPNSQRRTPVPKNTSLRPHCQSSASSVQRSPIEQLSTRTSLSSELDQAARIYGTGPRHARTFRPGRAAHTASNHCRSVNAHRRPSTAPVATTSASLCSSPVTQSRPVHDPGTSADRPAGRAPPSTPMAPAAAARASTAISKCHRCHRNALKRTFPAAGSPVPPLRPTRSLITLEPSSGAQFWAADAETAGRSAESSRPLRPVQ
jgi:hypothetical protein